MKILRNILLFLGACLLGLALAAQPRPGVDSPTPAGYLTAPTTFPGKVAVRWGTGNIVTIKTPFHDGTHDLVVTMGPYNVNALFGFKTIGTSPNTKGVPSINFSAPVTIIQNLSTDMVGPWQISDIEDADGGTEQWTGGGHNSTGAASSTGTPTARMLSLALWLDGVPLAADGVVRQGSRLDIRTVNRIQAYNTLVAQREVLEERILFTITESGFEVNVEAMALEELSIARYYGLQVSNVGMTSIHWPQDAVDTRRNLSGDMNPGTLDTAPNVNRFVLKGSGMVLVGWVDRSYGIGTLAGLFHTLSPSFVDGTAQKTYFYMIHGVVSDASQDMVSGDVVRWRGGWYFGADLGLPGGDCGYLLSNAGKRQYVADFLQASTNAYLPVQPEDSNGTVTVISKYGTLTTPPRATANGVRMTSSGASAVVMQLGYNPLFSLPTNGNVIATPSDPTGAASGAVMMGTKVSFTPVVSSRALVIFTFQAANSVSSNGVTFTLRYGTGTAPNNAAGVTGTQIGASQTKNSGNAAYSDGETCMGVVTNLVPGTTYWFDISLAQVSSGTATAKGITATVIEI